MGTMTIVFLVVGGIGALLLLLGLVGVELFDLDGFVPLEVMAAMLGMFGFAAAATSSLVDLRGAPMMLASVGVGTLVAIPAGWVTLRIVRAATTMHTDATPERNDLIGLTGVVVTPIPASGYGEVRVTLGGQPVKLNATADSPIPLATQVFVIAAPSDTSVVVEPVPIA